ncbi:MAG: hypothetical protein J6Y57_04685 [Lachnospiraceae bacterium]|nr:hypothetical protein [Lachnospiraceae bacterium]
MSTMEIALLVSGVIIFVLSFLIPDKKKDNEQAGVDPQEIRKMVESELDGMKLRVNEATDETVEYAMEKAERQLERVSNEKIMALSEYSDTIMEGIDKSHKEVLFMYDMLTDKQTDLKNTVRKAEATVKEVESVQQIPQPVQSAPEPAPVQETPVFVQQASAQESEFTRFVNESHTVDEFIRDEEGEENEEGNNNERILALNAQGLSTVDIARELGLGVGEVKLVIDLFKG